jgi:hypothetical protein
MTKTLTCRELGGLCDQAFSADTLMGVMQQAMPHMQSDDAHKAQIGNLSKTTGETREVWMARMQREFDAKPND